MTICEKRDDVLFAETSRGLRLPCDNARTASSITFAILDHWQYKCAYAISLPVRDEQAPVAAGCA
jgi:hypothetical protein